MSERGGCGHGPRRQAVQDPHGKKQQAIEKTSVLEHQHGRCDIHPWRLAHVRQSAADKLGPETGTILLR